MYSYDLVPYESRPFPETHPDSLATKAFLFGMKPQPVTHCRFLELGCTTGGNIIPMAFNLPDSQFLGIDLSARQIKEGQEYIQTLGLKNVELKHMNILDVNDDLGQFDYIVAHGVYSWVPEEVQEKILSCCHDLLKPDGVAYVSYNTFPGWHFWMIVRELMLYHTNQFEEPRERIREARAIFDFLKESVKPENGAFTAMLKEDFLSLKNKRDDYILHEFLETNNQPVYFSQFAERANSHGLQILSDAEFGMTQIHTLPDVAGELIRANGETLVQREQYIDFVRNRFFRSTLLCHADVALKTQSDYQCLRSLSVACPAQAVEDVAINNTELQTFRMASGDYYCSPAPLVKAAFQHLTAIYPRMVKFPELVKIARSKLPSDLFGYRGSFETNSTLLAEAILTAYAYDVVTLSSSPPTFCMRLSDFPKASILARYQAHQQWWLTTQRHEPFFLSKFCRILLEFLDGKHSKDQLLELMRNCLHERKLLPEDIATLAGDESLDIRLAKHLDDELAKLVNAAVLTD